MKLAFLVAALFLFVAAPVDAADPAPDCAEIDIVKNLAARVSLRRDCSLEAAIFEDVTCVGGWGDSVERNVDKHTVKAYYCTGGPSPIAWPPELAGPSCKAISENIVIGTVDISTDCHTQVDIKFYDCIWNCGWETIVDNDVLTVRHYTQQDGGTQMAALQPCQDQTIGFWGAQVDTREDCTADVGLIDAYRLCPTGTTAEARGATAGGNMVSIGYCVPDLQLATAAPSCNGIWYYSETFDVGRKSVTVETDGSLDCTHVTIS